MITLLIGNSAFKNCIALETIQYQSTNYEDSRSLDELDFINEPNWANILFNTPFFPSSSSSSSSSSGSSVGDPYITTIDGTLYKLPNVTGNIRLFDNMDNSHRVVVNAEIWQLPKSIYNRAVKELGANIDFEATYLKTVFIHEDGYDPIIFDLERLQHVSGKVTKSVSLEPYNGMDVYKNEKYCAIKIKVHNITVELQRFVNPQIRTGVVIDGEHLEKGFGALVAKYAMQDVLLRRLQSTKMIHADSINKKGKEIKEEFNGTTIIMNKY